MLLFGHESSQTKGYVTGTHRSVSPAQTLKQLLPMLPSFEITRVAEITGLDDIGLPVFVAIRPNSRGLATSQGKGWDRDSAKVSAIMESVESWHGERVRGELCYESRRALARLQPVVDAAQCLLAPGAVFHEDAPTYWLKGWDLVQCEWCWVPYATVSTNFVVVPGVTPVFRGSSNGLASGNHLLEATVHAVCELIERDAQALWSLRSAEEKSTTQVDLRTVTDGIALRTLELISRAGLETIVRDLTSDLGVPAYSAGIFDRGLTRRVAVAAGYGCHLAPEIALMRALSEAVQARATIISGSRDDLTARNYRAALSEETVRQLALEVDARPAERAFERPSLATESFDGDLSLLVERLSRAGLDRAVVCNLTDPEFQVPVVKVVVPGLEGLRTQLDHRPGRRAQALIERERDR